MKEIKDLRKCTRILMRGNRRVQEMIEVVVFPGVIEKKPQIFQENKIVMVKGRVNNKDSIPKVICKKTEEINES